MDKPDLSELVENAFHGAALTAFVAQARAERAWPCPLATRQLAYALYEAEIANAPRNRASCPVLAESAD